MLGKRKKCANIGNNPRIKRHQLIYSHSRVCWTCGSLQGNVKCKGVQTEIGITVLEIGQLEGLEVQGLNRPEMKIFGFHKPVSLRSSFVVPRALASIYRLTYSGAALMMTMMMR